MKKNIEFKYQKLSNNFNINDWIIGSLNPKSNVIILFLQGGPSLDLYFDPKVTISEIIKNRNLDDETIAGMKIYLKITKNFKNNLLSEFDIIQVKQTQNIKKDLETTTKSISVETSKKEQKENIDALDNVIKYYKKQHKKVVVIGHSVGGWIINNYLSHYKPRADLFVVGNSRLDIPLVFPMIVDQENIIPFLNLKGKMFNDKNNFKFLSMKDTLYKRVGLHLTYSRFTKKLKNKNLDKVIYITCEGDMWVSVLNEEEISFIKNRGGKIIINKLQDKDDLNKLSFNNDFGATAHTTVFLKPVVDKIKKEINERLLKK